MQLGQLQVIDNKDREFGSANEYFFVKVRDADGNELPLMFTEFEIREARRRAEKNPEDFPENENCHVRLRKFVESLNPFKK